MGYTFRDSRGSTWFGAVVLLAVAGAVACWDVLTISRLARQASALGHPTTHGTVTLSRVRHTFSGKSTNAHPDIHYTYAVDGRTYTGDRYSRSRWGGKAYAERIVSAHRVGSAVTVHYNPAASHDAVLDVRVRGVEFTFILLLLPLNIMIAYFAWGLLRDAIHWPRPRAALPLVPLGGATRLRMPRAGPALVLTATSSIGAAAGCATLFAADAMGAETSAGSALLIVGSMVAACGVMLGRDAYVAAAGRRDVDVDFRARTLTLPRGKGAAIRPVVPFARIADIDTELKMHRSQRHGTTFTHLLRIRWRDERSQEQTTHAGEYDDKADAERAVAWLREQVAADDRSIARR